jgi:hypothetical protein
MSIGIGFFFFREGGGETIDCCPLYRVRSPPLSSPVFKFKVIRLKELELDRNSLFGSQLVQLRGSGDADPLGRVEHGQLLLLDGLVPCVGQGLKQTTQLGSQDRGPVGTAHFPEAKLVTESLFPKVRQIPVIETKSSQTELQSSIYQVTILQNNGY